MLADSGKAWFGATVLTMRAYDHCFGWRCSLTDIALGGTESYTGEEREHVLWAVS